MSRTRPTDREWAMLAVPCERCGARADQWCGTSRTGRWAKTLHADRFYVARDEAILWRGSTNGGAPERQDQREGTAWH